MGLQTFAWSGDKRGLPHEHYRDRDECSGIEPAPSAANPSSRKKPPRTWPRSSETSRPCEASVRCIEAAGRDQGCGRLHFGDGSREGRRHDRDGRRVESVRTGIPSSSFQGWTGALEHEGKLKPEQEPPPEGQDACDLHAAEDLKGGSHR